MEFCSGKGETVRKERKLHVWIRSTSWTYLQRSSRQKSWLAAHFLGTSRRLICLGDQRHG